MMMGDKKDNAGIVNNIRVTNEITTMDAFAIAFRKIEFYVVTGKSGIFPASKGSIWWIMISIKPSTWRWNTRT